MSNVGSHDENIRCSHFVTFDLGICFQSLFDLKTQIELNNVWCSDSFDHFGFKKENRSKKEMRF